MQIPTTPEQVQELERELTASAQRRGVPEGLIDGLVLYVVHGVPPGSFLYAVLTNDLMEAFGRADERSAAGMRAIVMFLYNDVPSTAFRSKERIAAWCEHKGAAGLAALLAEARDAVDAVDAGDAS